MNGSKVMAFLNTLINGCILYLQEVLTYVCAYKCYSNTRQLDAPFIFRMCGMCSGSRLGRCDDSDCLLVYGCGDIVLFLLHFLCRWGCRHLYLAVGVGFFSMACACVVMGKTCFFCYIWRLLLCRRSMYVNFSLFSSLVRLLGMTK